MQHRSVGIANVASGSADAQGEYSFRMHAELTSTTSTSESATH